MTATESVNLWGFILLRDINEHSPTYRTLDVAERSFTIKALSVEDLFLLKLNAGREKDRQDLPLIAAKTTPEALIERFNVVVQWHGNKPAVPGYADEFVRQLEACYALAPVQVISKLKLPKFVESMLWKPDIRPRTIPQRAEQGQPISSECNGPLLKRRSDLRNLR